MGKTTNENSNELIRDYFPAGTDFSTISKARLKEVQNQLNERPRHVLDYRTPKEVFEEIILNKLDKVFYLCGYDWKLQRITSFEKVALLPHRTRWHFWQHAARS